MKIALVCPYNMFERTGGVQQLVTHLHGGLVKKGHLVKVITQRPSGFKGPIPDDYILFGISRDFTGGLGMSGNWGMPSDSNEIGEILKRRHLVFKTFKEPGRPMLAGRTPRHPKAALGGPFPGIFQVMGAAKS